MPTKGLLLMVLVKNKKGIKRGKYIHSKVWGADANEKAMSTKKTLEYNSNLTENYYLTKEVDEKKKTVKKQ